MGESVEWEVCTERVQRWDGQEADGVRGEVRRVA